MATQFVPVLTPEGVWDLWEAGLLYEKHSGPIDVPNKYVDKQWYLNAWAANSLCQRGDFGYLEEA